MSEDWVNKKQDTMIRGYYTHLPRHKNSRGMEEKPGQADLY